MRHLESGSRSWSRRPVLVAVLGFVLLGVGLFAALAALSVLAKGGGFAGGGKERIAIIDVEGRLVSSEQIVRQVRRYADDELVKGVVLRVDSPGGGVAAAQEIHREVKRLREAGKKVVASMGSVAASGGYYIACAADEIVANPGSITGSIGVILALPNLHQLMEKVGLETVVVKSGEHKDIGSPVRPMTAEEREILQRMIDDVHEQFIEVVIAGRGLPRERVLQLSDGSVFSGRQAKELGLVDNLGDMDDAVQLAARLAGISGKPSIVRERLGRGILRRLLEGNLSDILFPLAGEQIPTIQYLWRY